MVTWIFSVYYAGVEELKQGLPYEQTQLRCLEPQNIFRQVLLQVSLSIEIVPFIIMGAIIVYDDLKEKTLLQIAVINRNKWKYFIMDTFIQTNNTELFKDMQNLYKNILI